MLAHYFITVCIRPVNRLITLPTFRSRLYSRTSRSIRSGKFPQFIYKDVSSHWGPRGRTLVQGTHMLCSSADTKLEDKNEFRLIYKFPGIRMCKVVSKLKILQTGLTFTILPPVYYLYLQGQMSLSSAMYLTGLALFAGAMLYSLTFYLRRIIGMMYVNHNATTLRVAHLSFWGNRRDLYVPVEDLKKLTETGDSKGEVLLSLKRYSSPETFYFTLRYGHILDKDTFRFIFGELK